MEQLVQSYVENGVGWIILNRPRALNALSFEMVDQIGKQLEQWKTDQGVSLIGIEGAGEKGLCAGGDIRALYDQRNSNLEEAAFSFFSTEYRMNIAVHQYPKPILAYMNGIVMGGGVGISAGAKYRIVTEKTKWAMPEMNIGFFPDVGASYFMNSMPGYLGRYLALSSLTVGPADVLYLGAADYYMDSQRWGDFRQAVREQNWELDTADKRLGQLLDQYTVSTIPDAKLEAKREKIDRHFSRESMEEIMQSLDSAAVEGDEWAAQTADLLREKSPTSLKVTLEQMKRGSGKPLSDCFAMELALSMNLVKSHDFAEGVRAVLVDKDRNPKWSPASLEEVREEDVSACFQYSRAEGFESFVLTK